MTDLICRKTMTRCLAAGMCSPHGGYRPELTPTAQSLLVERDLLQAEVQRLESEVKYLRKQVADFGVFKLVAAGGERCLVCGHLGGHGGLQCPNTIPYSSILGAAQ